MKHYGVVFTCLNTRAVHLELAVDYSAMEFIKVLRCFFAIRGRPALILSDNGTKLVGAERELREIIEGWDKEKLENLQQKRGSNGNLSYRRRLIKPVVPKPWLKAVKER